MKKLFFFFSLFTTLNIFAHGLDKPGPHGGQIKMPGTFHVELLDKGENFIVYLLDMHFNQPITAQSSVILNNQNCIAQNEYFVCPKPKQLKEIKINAVRDNQKGSEAIYTYPLKKL
jgi:hypothetical protein